MAVFHPFTVRCECGNTITAQLADSLNVKRSPDVRDKIIRGELHRIACSVCNRRITVEKPFYYTDLLRNTFYKVFPRGERHRWKESSRQLDRAVSYFPKEVSAPEGRTLRVVFGMDELREKLIAQDANIDDRIVELLKVFLVHEHPVLLRRARLRLTLDEATDDAFVFGASYEHHPQKFRLSIPTEIVKDIAADPKRLSAWVKGAHPSGSIFELDDHWVNMWRWSPQPSALDLLKGYAERVRNGEDIDTGDPAFQKMLDQIPKGNHLPAWAKKDLRNLFEYAKAQNDQTLEDRLFEIRFEIELEDDWAMNGDPNDIDTLWKLLKDLPDSNVEGNTKIGELLLGVGDGGGTYDPNTYDISIGSDELSNRERFEDVTRHEVGHAVHEMHDKTVNDWLNTRFGWQIFGGTDQDIDQWMSLMGAGTGLSAQHRKEVRQYLRMALGGGGSWEPGPTPSPPAGHPWYAGDFGPRLAFERSGRYWFQNYKTWYRANGKAFYLNFWYRTLMIVEAATLDLVSKMPDSYASMSHFEFFAELYALHYDLDDPKRKEIPVDVSTWLDKYIGSPQADAPMPSAPEEKEHWETITRPGKGASQK